MHPFAIIDYGIGGLGLYRKIRQDFPKLPLIYLSDSGEIPYGKLSKAALRARIEKVFRFLESEGAGKIIVACHSASSVVKTTDKNAIGLRTQTVEAVVKRKPKSVGIIGGGRTIRSGFYRRALGEAGIGASQRIAQPLSILVERGEIDTPLVDESVSKVMKPLDHCDSILLACTHYPVLSDVILRYVPKGTKLIDPIGDLYKSIKPEIKKYSRVRGDSIFMTTGDAKLMRRAALNAFGIRISAIRKVTIS